MEKVLELKERAGKLYHEARAMWDKAESEKRAFTTEEQTQFDAMHNDADALMATAERGERQAKVEAIGKNDDESAAERRGAATGEPEARGNQFDTPEYRKAFETYLRTGNVNAFAEVRETLQQDNDLGGGFFATTHQLVSQVLKNADSILPLRALATTYRVARGTTLGVPYLDGDISAFEFGSGELTAATEDTGLSFKKRELKPRDLKKKIIKISKSLAANSSIDLIGYVSQRVAYALSKGLEQAYMTGNGAEGPLGLFTASADGIPTSRDVITGSATGVTTDGLITIQDSLNAAYQNNARWLFHQDFLTLIRKLKDGNQQYIFVPGLQSGVASTILGKPYVLADLAPNTYTNGLYCAMYADFSYYWIADALDMAVQVLVELYAATDQIGLKFSNLSADAAPVLAEAFVRAKCAA